MDITSEFNLELRVLTFPKMTVPNYVVIIHFKSFVSILPHYAIHGPCMHRLRRPQTPRWLGGHLL